MLCSALNCVDTGNGLEQLQVGGGSVVLGAWIGYTIFCGDAFPVGSWPAVVICWPEGNTGEEAAAGGASIPSDLGSSKKRVGAVGAVGAGKRVTNRVWHGRALGLGLA